MYSFIVFNVGACSKLFSALLCFFVWFCCNGWCYCRRCASTLSLTRLQVGRARFALVSDMYADNFGTSAPGLTKNCLNNGSMLILRRCKTTPNFLFSFTSTFARLLQPSWLLVIMERRWRWQRWRSWLFCFQCS